MNKTDKKVEIATSRLLTYIGMAIFAAMPLYFLIYLFAGYFTKSDDEEIAAATTILFFVGVFVGRFLAHLWKNKLITNTILLTLVFFLVVGGFLLAFILENSFNHQDFLVFVLAIALFFLESILLGLIIKLIRDKVYRQINTAETSAAASQSELALLQSQLSPHFLFNTLNNLYGISLKEHEKMPALLLKLSELLRYAIYDAKEPFVSLKEEIAYLKNYIEFEKIRIGERLDLVLDLEDIKKDKIQIAPMLLIVFIENAFKHSKNSSEDKIQIEISLKSWADSILFAVKNSCQNLAVEELNKKSGGLGLNNVKKRLNLLYSNKYDLQIAESNDFFQVKLRIDV